MQCLRRCSTRDLHVLRHCVVRWCHVFEQERVKNGSKREKESEKTKWVEITNKYVVATGVTANRKRRIYCVCYTPRASISMLGQVKKAEFD